MTTATIAGHDVHVNDEGFLTDYDEWTEEIATQLAANIGIEMTERHWEMVRFLRGDYAENQVTPWYPTGASRWRIRYERAVHAVPEEACQEECIRRWCSKACWLRLGIRETHDRNHHRNCPNPVIRRRRRDRSQDGHRVLEGFP